MKMPRKPEKSQVAQARI